VLLAAQGSRKRCWQPKTCASVASRSRLA
jgi:hypothetical protein